MGKVINIEDFRKEPPDRSTWVADISLSMDEEGYFFATIRDFNDDTADTVADRFRVLANGLFHVAWLSMKAAHQEEPNDDGDLLAVSWVFESSRVRVQIDDERVVSDEQMDWLESRFDDAKEAARP